MEYLCLDIETVPLTITDDNIKNYLMDKKISKEARSLDPNYSKIITIALKMKDKEAFVLYGDDEKQLLNKFWYIVKGHPNALFITHNGYKFDIPFLNIRSIVNNVSIPISINLNRWRMESSNHFDTMLFFSQYETFTNPNLEILGRLHNLEISRERITGQDIEKFYLKKDWETIKQHCKEDVEILEKLFNKLFIDYFKDKRY